MCYFSGTCVEIGDTYATVVKDTVAMIVRNDGAPAIEFHVMGMALVYHSMIDMPAALAKQATREVCAKLS